MKKVKKRRSAISRKRKPPRTAAQKRAIKKLIALNKRRAKTRRKPAPKKRPLSPAAKRAVKRRKTARRKSHTYVIKVVVGGPTRKHFRWYTGKGFAKLKESVNYPPKRFTSRIAAQKEVEKIFPHLPKSIRSIEICKL